MSLKGRSSCRRTKNLKQRTFLTTLYATGIRFSEAANLRIADIDSKRMQIRITNGKGAKQRQVPLSPRLLVAASQLLEIVQAAIAALSGQLGYLVDAISLRESFRTAAIAHLKRLYKNGKLKLGGKFAHLQDADAWDVFCNGLGEMEWVSFIQPPPTKSCSAEHAVRYLTRYLTGGPISDSRIIEADENHVTFLAREGKRVGGEREQVPVKLDTLEFMRRWCDHIQPDQLTKTRYFGGWCSRRRTRYQTRCRELLGQSQEPRCSSANEHAEPAESTQSSAESASSDDSATRCQACEHGSLRLIGSTAKPTWTMLLTHFETRCPSWYAD